MSERQMALPASPCTGVCRLDPVSGLCRGCYRTGGEIARWTSLTPGAKWDLLLMLEERRAAAKAAAAGR